MTTASTHTAQGYVDPVAAEWHFSQQFDLQNPQRALNSYQKLMHQHTKQQFEIATTASRRRTFTPTERSPISQESSEMSVSSTGS